MILCSLIALAGTDCRAETPLREVIVYLANETAPVDAEQQNYDTITNWLNSESSAATQRIATSLTRDRRHFAGAVDLEVGDLTLELAREQAARGLVVVSNRMARAGKCLIWRLGDNSVQEISLPVDTSHEHLVLKANPLSRADCLAEILAFVAERFPAREHQFVLLLKSHGSGQKVLTPRLAVRADETSRQEILRIARNEIADNELPLWTDRLGVTKAELLEVLTEAGREHGMQFPLVFLEACNAVKHDFTAADLPPNVERLLLIRERANYINVLYADVVQQQEQAGSFVASLLTNLPDKFELIDRQPLPSPHSSWLTWPRIKWFLPLAGWLMWVGWRYGRQCRHTANRVQPES